MARGKKRDNYQEVTDRIIEALESGVAPWTCPWDRSLGLPRNGHSNHVYQGINVWLTFARSWAENWADPRFFTFNQVRKNYKDAHVRKGEKGTQIIKWLFLTPQQRSDESDVDYDQRKQQKVPVLKLYTVFNTEQIEWGEAGAPPMVKGDVIDPAKVYAESTAFLQSVGATIKHGSMRASYDPKNDVIKLPAVEAFKTEGDYFATAFHELIHWTGHESRCARNLKARFGSREYAAEELVAELGAAFLCADHGIEGKLQHENYINDWLKVLKGDKFAIFTAARLARKAADFTQSGVDADQKSSEKVA